MTDPFTPPDPKDKYALGGGMSMKDWLAKPDKQVTRREVWDFFRHYEFKRRAFDQRRRWHRRFWRWLMTPVRPLDGDQ